MFLTLFNVQVLHLNFNLDVQIYDKSFIVGVFFNLLQLN